MKQSGPVNKSPPPTPPILYHYTTLGAFYEIMTTRQLWASNISYLNDAKEFELAKDIAGRLIDDHLQNVDDRAAEPNRVVQTRLKNMRTLLGQVIATDTFIFSLTEEGDQLSQWRAYCRDGGVAIGFDTDRLTRLMEHLHFFLAKCSYDPRENKVRLARDIEETLRLRAIGNDGENSISTFWLNQLATAAVHMKHEGFAEEREWRLVSHPEIMSHLDHPRVKYRATNSFMIPYCELPLDLSFTEPSYDARWPEVIVSVRIGPTAHDQLMSNVVERFLRAHGSYVTPTTCGIPLREL